MGRRPHALALAMCVALACALLAVTPISAFRPRRWRGALLPSESVVIFDILEHEKRPVAAVADRLCLARMLL